jgi:hypothetical protein
MAQFSIEIADQDVNRVLNAVAKNYNRPDKVANPAFDPGRPENPGDNPREIENPESVHVFVNRIVRKFLSENVKAYEVKEAKRIAAEEAANNTDPVINDPQLP